MQRYVEVCSRLKDNCHAQMFVEVNLNKQEKSWQVMQEKHYECCSVMPYMKTSKSCHFHPSHWVITSVNMYKINKPHASYRRGDSGLRAVKNACYLISPTKLNEFYASSILKQWKSHGTRGVTEQKLSTPVMFFFHRLINKRKQERGKKVVEEQ